MNLKKCYKPYLSIVYKNVFDNIKTQVIFNNIYKLNIADDGRPWKGSFYSP